MTIVGVSRAVAAGCSVATAALAEAFGLGLGDALADALGDAACDGVDEGCAVGVPIDVGDAVGANVAVVPGSGVKLGRAVGACGLPPAPKILVNKPPSSKPPRITSTTNGMIGIPPRLGGSGSRRRRRG
jgi:hypothetical protein